MRLRNCVPVQCIWLFIIFGLPAGCFSAPDIPGVHLDKIEMPSGFRIALYARADGARSLALGSNGTVFAGTRREGRVYALTGQNKDGSAETVRIIAEGLDTPNGVAFHDGALYVAEIGRIIRFDHIEDHLDKPPEPVTVFNALPADKGHGWKFIAFGPDNRLYVPVGAPCNVCDRQDPRYAAILRIQPETGETAVFARGIRNTVGFDWHPRTHVLWFTDNGAAWGRPVDVLVMPDGALLVSDDRAGAVYRIYYDKSAVKK